jgi:subtilisin family serine protease
MAEYGLKLGVKQVVPFLPIATTHSPQLLGSTLCGTGEGVKVAIVDSGRPDHNGIHTVVEEVNFTESDDEKDVIGHSTIVSGFIAANKPENVIGIAPLTSLYYAKIVDDVGKVRFDSFVAAVLWCIIKDVDVMAIMMTTDVHNPSLRDAIIKANQAGICIVATAGDGDTLSYPGRYPGVLSVGAAGKLQLPTGPFYSTYLEQQYAEVNGNSVSTAFAAGLCALAIQQAKKRHEKYKPSDIYKTVIDSCARLES